MPSAIEIQHLTKQFRGAEPVGMGVGGDPQGPRLPEGEELHHDCPDTPGRRRDRHGLARTGVDGAYGRIGGATDDIEGSGHHDQPIGVDHAARHPQRVGDIPLFVDGQTEGAARL